MEGYNNIFQAVDSILNRAKQDNKEQKCFGQMEKGYLSTVLGKDVPQKSSNLQSVLQDFEKFILPGLIGCQHPQNHAHFHSPAPNLAAVFGNAFGNAVAPNATEYNACPLVIELERTMCDWLCSMFNLPGFFRSCNAKENPGKGLGVVQTCETEAVLFAINGAMRQAIEKLQKKYTNMPRAVLMRMLVVYSSDQCGYLGERCANYLQVNHRILETVEHYGNISSQGLRNAIEQDGLNGKIPIFLLASCGTINMGCFDDLRIIGPICNKNNIWLHVVCTIGGGPLVAADKNAILSSPLIEGLKFAASIHMDLSLA